MQTQKKYLLLHLLLLFFSLSPVCSKMAALQPIFSISFFFWYGLVIFILGIYAIFWQQVIKRTSLTAAYANRAVTVVWGLLWGVLFFKESITPLRLIGAGVVVIGIVFYSFSDKAAVHDGGSK